MAVLIINAIAVLSEDRFLARSTFLSPPPSATGYTVGNVLTIAIRIVGWGRTQAEPGFGATPDSTSVKAKSINLIASVRTVMRSMSTHLPFQRNVPFHGRGFTVRQQPEEEIARQPEDVKLMRDLPTVPLIVINTIIIIYELILG